MSGSRLAFLLTAALALAGLGALNAAVRPDPGRRNLEVFTEMAYSRAYESFTPNPNFADGKTLQPVVAGVVPRGGLPFPFGEGPEEARRAGRELVDPLPPDDPAVAERGAALFAIYCTPCHDARGNGQGPVVLRGMLPPPSLHADRARDIGDGEIFHILTMGQGNMPSYAAQLPADERWSVIRHVRALQEQGP